MAHFAELNENNVVLRVVVIDNKDTSDANGVEKEYIGTAYCERLFGGVWKQTSYNATIRKNYAGVGYTFDEMRDAFIPPKHYESWVLDENTCQWTAPIAMPDDGKLYLWSEEQQAWVELDPEANQ
jgi:hypothetical protein